MYQSLYEYEFSKLFAFWGDYHFSLAPCFSLYPGSLYPYLQLKGGLASQIIMPLNIILSLSGDIGFLLNPLNDFDDKWIDGLLSFGLSGFGGFYYDLSSNYRLIFGGRIILQLFISIFFPTPFRNYYSGELVIGVNCKIN